jgi:hypothetical protein
MNDIDLSAPHILHLMQNGATLQRHGDVVEMDIPDTSAVRVPLLVFDNLLKQQQIEACGGGYYRLTGKPAAP